MVKADRQKREQEARNYEKFIERQVGHAVRPYRADGYVNLLNRYGTSRDTTEQYRFENEEPVPDETLVQFYEGNGMFAKIIDAPADECVKHGFELEGLTDEKIIRFYQDGLGELEWEENISTAIKWARLFGGSIAVMLINDGRGLDEPLDWDNIKSIDDIRVYDRSLIQPDYSSMFEYDADDPFRTRGSRLGMPEYYDVFSKWGNFRVHDSRCLVFQNGTLPENCTNSTYQLWGMPEYVRIQRAIRDAEVAHGSAVKLLDRSVQAIYKMKDLAAELATEEGEDRVLRRLQTIDMARGLLNSITIDSEGEEYDFRQFSYTGVAQVIDTTCNYLSAVTNIPQTILFGRSPAGMNATGHGDLENWYSYVERMQRRMVKKNLRYLLSVLFQAGVATGEVDEVPEIDVKFNPLWTLTDQEQAALEQQKASTEQVRAQTAQLYVDMQAIDPSEVRQKLADSADFDIETMLDDYTEEELEENAPKGEEGGEDPMAAMMGGMGGGGPEGAPEGAPGGAPPEMPGGATQPPEKVSEAEGNEEPDGNAPIAAPDATRLPEDMGDTPKKKEIDQIDSDTEETEGSEEAEEPKPDNDAHKYGGVGVIVIQDGKVLCARRHNDTGYGLICGPGGSIEGEETAEEAAIREAQEEFGITPLDIFPLGTCDEQVDGSKPMVFVCTRYGGTIECGDLEMVNPRFLTLEALWKAKDDLFVPFRDSLYLLGDKMGFEFDRGEPEEETRFEGDNEPPFYENGLLTGKDLMKQFTHARVKYRNDRKEMKRSFSKASFDGVSGQARVGIHKTDRADEENWKTINGTHVEIDKSTGEMTKGPQALKEVNKKRIQGTKESAPKGTGSSSAWKDTVKSKREEHKAMKPAKKALLLNDLYGVEDGDLKYEQILEAFQAEDGSLDKMVDDYYDIMEKNGDPTPTKATADQRRDFASIVSNEYGGKWTEARLGEMKKDTGFEGEKAEKVFKELGTWVGNGWSNADKDTLNEFVAAAPAFDGPMFRGMHFEPDEGTYDEFMKKVKVGGEMKMSGPASWASDREVARRFAHMGDHTYDSIMVRCIQNRTSTPIGYINAQGEAEVLSSGDAKWTVLDVVEYDDRGGRKAVITVIEQGE